MKLAMFTYLNFFIIVVLDHLSVVSDHLTEVSPDTHPGSAHLHLHIPHPFSGDKAPEVSLDLNNQSQLSHGESLLQSNWV